METSSGLVCLFACFSDGGNCCACGCLLKVAKRHKEKAEKLLIEQSNPPKAATQHQMSEGVARRVRPRTRAQYRASDVDRVTVLNLRTF